MILFMSCLSKYTENADFECVCQSYLFYFIYYVCVCYVHFKNIQMNIRKKSLIKTFNI